MEAGLALACLEINKTNIHPFIALFSCGLPWAFFTPHFSHLLVCCAFARGSERTISFHPIVLGFELRSSGLATGTHRAISPALLIPPFWHLLYMI